MDDENSAPQAERRRASRASIELVASVREVGQHRVPAQVTSFSRFGCGMTGPLVRSAENAMWVRLPGLEAQCATVRWSTTEACGVEFAHPLHPAVASTFMGPSAEPDPVPGPTVFPTAPDTAGQWPDSRRHQILQGQAERSYNPLSVKTRAGGDGTLSGLIRRHKARVADHRHELRYPAPAKLREMPVQGQATAVLDISNSGLRLGRQLSGTIGDPVMLHFAGFEAVEATLVWTGNEATGLSMPENSIELVEAR
jgi:hypothetical protein